MIYSSRGLLSALCLGFSGAVFAADLLVSDPNPENTGWFGYSVDVDGDYMVVGAPFKNYGKGEVNIFHRLGDSVIFEDSIKPTDTSIFGRTVAISGSRIVASDIYTVSVYDKFRTSWPLTFSDSSAYDLGYEIDIYRDGYMTQAIVSDYYAQGARIYKNNWYIGTVNGTESSCGYAVAIGKNFAAVACPYGDEDFVGRLLLFSISSDAEISLFQTILTDESSGDYHSLSMAGNYLIIGNYYGQATTVYQYTDSWAPYSSAEYPCSLSATALSSDGTALISSGYSYCAAYYEGVVYSTDITLSSFDVTFPSESLDLYEFYGSSIAIDREQSTNYVVGHFYGGDDNEGQVFWFYDGDSSEDALMCDEEFTEVSGQCYEMLMIKQSRDKAEKMCEDDGAWLAHFDTVGTYWDVTSALSVTNNFWVGARKVGKVYRWYGEDGLAGSKVDTSLWSAHDTSDSHPCVQGWYGNDMLLDDIKCSLKKWAICQKDKA